MAVFFQIKSSLQFRCFSNGKKKVKKKDDLTPRRYGDISFDLQLFGLVKICNSPGEIQFLRILNFSGHVPARPHASSEAEGAHRAGTYKSLMCFNEEFVIFYEHPDSSKTLKYEETQN